MKKFVQILVYIVPNEGVQALLPLPHCNYATIHQSIHPFIHQSIPTGSSRNLVQYLLTRLQRLRSPSKQRISLKVFLISWLLSA